jgi:predicted alpha/beta hydrolase family esterase
MFDWPADGRLTIPMAGKVTGAYLLAQPKKPLDVVCTGEAVVITVPTSPPDPIVSVVVASVKGEVRPVQSSPAQAKDGTSRAIPTTH